MRYASEAFVKVSPNDSFGFSRCDVFERMDKEVDFSKLGLAAHADNVVLRRRLKTPGRKVLILPFMIGVSGSLITRVSWFVRD